MTTHKLSLSIDNLSVDCLAILQTQSTTFKCDDMKKEVLKQIQDIKGITLNQDAYGNLYASKGKAETFPAFACHLDTVHPIKENFEVHQDSFGFWFATSNDDGDLSQVGIGGDDKCGIIACIELLHRLKNVKCAFFLDEEKGCKGSEVGHLPFFDNCRYIIQVDRKHHDDIIVEGSGTRLCSEEFESMLNTLGEVYGYKSTTGMTTDVVALKRRGLKISAVNLSAGYHNPHGKNEYIREDQLLNCIAFCIAISRITTVYPHEYVAPPVTAVTKYNDNYGQYHYVSKRKSKYLPDQTSWACLQCDKTLSWGERDDRVCKECMDAFWKLSNGISEDIPEDSVYEQIPTLVVDEDGKESLVLDGEVEEKVISFLPQSMWHMLPSSNCLMCNYELFFEHEKAQGYCKSCECCSECGERVSDEETLIARLCQDHLDALGVTPSCSHEGCDNMLKTVDEISNDICDDCVTLLYI